MCIRDSVRIVTLLVMWPQGEDEDLRTAVVEFQAFRGVQNEYVIKEFAAVDLTTRCFTVAFFAPPYELSRLTAKTIRTNEWLERRYHLLGWDVEDG